MAIDTQGGSTRPDRSNKFIAGFMRWIAHFGNEFYVALFVGWIGELAFAFSAHTDWRDCLRGFFILWFSGAGTFFVGSLFGFLFGFPKSGSGSNLRGQAAGYRDNTNLEEVSDWLTKIVVGVSLAEFRDIFATIDQFAKAMDSAFSHNSGAYPVSVGVLVYGFVCGFMAYYTWARSRFRRNLESPDTVG
jgi:hypothetical protein